MSKSETSAPRYDVLTVRFPKGMLDTLRHEAARNDRSLNAEIVHAFRHLGEQPHTTAKGKRPKSGV